MPNDLLGFKELEQLLMTRGENETFTIAYKLSIRKHLKVRRQDRQRVRPAAELLSATTAHALEYLFPTNPRMLTLARFIRLADMWFDLLNSGKGYHHKDVKCAFGLKLDAQMELIEKVKKEISELRVGNRKEMIDWQKGLLQSINALPMLLNDLKKVDDYGVCSTKYFYINIFSAQIYCPSCHGCQHL